MFSHDGEHGSRHSHRGMKSDGCVIYGTVLDSITTDPIEYASISIVKIDNDLSPCCKIKLPNAFVEKVKISLDPIICNCGKSLIME